MDPRAPQSAVPPLPPGEEAVAGRAPARGVGRRKPRDAFAPAFLLEPGLDSQLRFSCAASHLLHVAYMLKIFPSLIITAWSSRRQCDEQVLVV